MIIALGGCTVIPEPLTAEEDADRVAQDLQLIFANQPPLDHPIGMYEAMARALSFNLDRRLKLMEEILAQRDLNLTGFDLLPKMVTRAGYSDRSNIAASVSESVRTNRTSLEASTSQERGRFTGDLGLTWNILDFGVSYLGAHQQANRLLIAEERRRKVVHNIIQDVRASFWEAVTADRLLGTIDPLIARVASAQADARRIERASGQEPLDALLYQRSLAETMTELQELRQRLAPAKTRLAALMNIDVKQMYQLAVPAEQAVPEVRVDFAAIEKQALLHRPELREEAYQSRISEDEIQRTALRMLPGVDLGFTLRHDSNSFLVNNNWAEFGANVTWNLLEVLSGPDRLELAEAQAEVATARRQALTLAVMTQARIAWLRYADAVRNYEAARELADVDRRILDQMKSRRKAGTEGELGLIESELNALVSELRRDVAFAEVENAFGGLFISAGSDPVPETIATDAITDLATAIHNTFEQWRDGHFTAPVHRPVTES